VPRNNLFRRPATPGEARAVNAKDRGRLRRRLLVGLRRVITVGGVVMADVKHKTSLANRARHSTDPSLVETPFAILCAAQHELVESGQVVIVVVGGRRLIRPVDGPLYLGEAGGCGARWTAPVVDLATRRQRRPGGPT
jgi:hypothetical protein